MEPLDFLEPCFVGPYGENDELLEKMLVEFLRDNIYWRRNFHPEDTPPISTQACYKPDYLEFVAQMRRELHHLTANLKRSVPYFHPRYMGHMVSDLLLPGLIAQLVTTLYNPNNVSTETAPVTLQMELDAGTLLARMFGYAVDPNQSPCAWGHLTSGGTAANYEGLLNIRAAKFYPLALQTALAQHGISLPPVGTQHKPLAAYSAWELMNLSLEDVLALKQQCLTLVQNQVDSAQYRQIYQTIENERIEHLGHAAFAMKHWREQPPVLLVPITMHYSWEKAMKNLGFGARQIIRVPSCATMRMDSEALNSQLQRCHQQQIPVLAIIGVLGSTEYGSIDPVHEIIRLRDDWYARGLHCPVHIDAAWGGFLTSLFRDEHNTFVSRKHFKKQFKQFPSKAVYNAFAALKEVDSITIDPHKMGYLPYGVGAFVARNKEIARLSSQQAPYLFDKSVEEESEEEIIRDFGQRILEGSKPGAAAAAVYVTLQVLPLNNGNYGRIAAQTVAAAEYFWAHFDTLKQGLTGKINLTMPIAPDSNMVVFAINPTGNSSLDRLNLFARRIYKRLRPELKGPVQNNEFIGSHTLMFLDRIHPDLTRKLQQELNLDLPVFTPNTGNSDPQAASLFLFRHTLMNPWLLKQTDGKNYIDRYFEFLYKILLEELEHGTITPLN